eukprot:gnl/TRDRNA2_/TRDRNA2_36590_c0_seq1.p1 gnl/TRDRNA2_/TRDRNA2_36590_c0~~gnl/TRDRNA2_/TRDRNA2_36590_c0_seq1.p1  ORF type:complete len:544 (-),score=79.56 gnl/TRDRNA2_/TRDRNA2_36590_c0_seq1:22-1653(-)
MWAVARPHEPTWAAIQQVSAPGWAAEKAAGRLKLPKEALRVRLEAAGSEWRVGERVELSLALENASGEPLFVRLGVHTGSPEDGTTLAAMGLRCEVAESAPDSPAQYDAWESPRIFEPREIPNGSKVAKREHALHLPAWRAARIAIAGRAVGVAGLGYGLRFGDGSGDAAEVLLRLPLHQDSPSASNGIRRRVAFVLRPPLEANAEHRIPCARRHGKHQHDRGAENINDPANWTWVGPYGPPQAPTESACWQGEACSEPIVVSVLPPSAASGGSGSPRAAGTTVASAQLLTSPSPPLAPKPKGRARPRPGAKQGRAGPAPPRQRRVGAKAAARSASAPPPTVPPGTEEVAIEAADSQAQPLASASKAAAACRLPRMRKRIPHSSEQRGPGAITSWRNLTRCQDPLADPLVLELAEALLELTSPTSTVALLGDWLKTRTGQRFVASMRALGPRVLAMPEERAFAQWIQRPRVVGQSEEIILVVKWRGLAGSLGVVRQVVDERNLQVYLLGVLLLCEPRELRQASALVGETELACPVRVLPSLAF